MKRLPTSGQDVVATPRVLWTEDDWRCELHSAPGGEARLEIRCRETLVTTENLPGSVAELRADILRQRVLRGDLRVRR